MSIDKLIDDCRAFCAAPEVWAYAYYDCETTIVDGSPEPWDGARIVRDGFLFGPESKSLNGRYKVCRGPDVGPIEYERSFVGHNIGFDVRHLIWTAKGALEGWRNYRIIDTAINEYLISGQTHTFPSLEDCCAKYKIPFKKDDLITKYFEEGKGADVIIADGHEDRLLEYLKSDIEATKALYLAQVLDPANKRLLPHFWVQGQASLIYSAMAVNGIEIDETKITALRDRNLAFANKSEDLIRKVCHKELDHFEDDWKLTNRVFSTLLYDFPGIPYKKREVVGKYKSGKPKTKLVEHRAQAKALQVPPRAVYTDDVKANDNLGWPLGDKWLKALKPMIGGIREPIGLLPDLILKKRASDKMIGTYCEPLLTKHNRDGKVHGKIHSTATRTGRTASSNPNIQNQPEEIRRCMGGGTQFDISQFELWAAAILSGDDVLLRDVLEGDVHFETGKATFGWTDKSKVPDRERRVAKALNFGLIYLASDKRLATEAETDIETARRHRKSFSTRYHVFWDWAKRRHAHVHERPATFLKMDPAHNVPLHERVEESITGRRLTYTEKWTEWKKKATISPSDCVNYPIQSFATADLFPLALVAVFLYSDVGLRLTPDVAVHDSAKFKERLLAGSESHIAQTIRVAISKWARVYDIVNGVFLPPSVDFKKGEYWQ